MTINTTISGLLTPMAHESVTVGITSKELTQSVFQPRGSEAVRDFGNARVAIIQVEGKIRYWLDGATTPPTSTVGLILGDGDMITLSSFAQMKLFRAIREAGEVADATLRVQYLR